MIKLVFSYVINALSTCKLVIKGHFFLSPLMETFHFSDLRPVLIIMIFLNCILIPLVLCLTD